MNIGIIMWKNGKSVVRGITDSPLDIGPLSTLGSFYSIASQ